jgi:hypothetical protein
VYNLLAHSRLYLAEAFVRSFYAYKDSISCIGCGICDYFFCFIGKPLNGRLQV